MPLSTFERMGLVALYAPTLQRVRVKFEGTWMPYYRYLSQHRDGTITAVRVTLDAYENIDELLDLLEHLPSWASPQLRTQNLRGESILTAEEPIAVNDMTVELVHDLACQHDEDTPSDEEPVPDAAMRWEGPLEETDAETAEDAPDPDGTTTGGPPTKHYRRDAEADPAAGSSKANPGSHVSYPRTDNPTPGGIPRIKATLVNYGVSAPLTTQEAPDATHIGTSLCEPRRGGDRRRT